MAGSSTVVDLLIKAKDLASAPIRGIVASIKFLDSEISVVAGKIRDAFSGLFGGGLDGAMEFEAQLSKVAAKGGFTAAEMAKLKQAATDIGARFGTTGTEAAQGMEALAASGLSAVEVMQALPPVLALAKAEELSMDAAAEKLSDSLATMGLGFDQAGRLANVLAKGANISTTSASALAEALATGGGIARDFGLNLEQSVGALAAFANNGIKGSAAGTALQAILTQLINPSSQASKALAALGIETRDFGEVIGALASKGEAGNAAILAFGETAGPGLRALLKTGQQGLADLTGQLQSADGAAEAAATGIGGNLKGALSDLTAAWANVKTALFDPVLEPLAKQARELADTLNTQLASGALKPVQEAIRSFATNGAQAARDFVAGFDFKAASQSLQEFATAAKDSFTGIKDAGTAAANVVQIAWNGLTSGFKTIGASLLAVASSAVSNIAAIEAAASKVGLGSLERASELKATAIELKATAEELVQSIAKDGEDIRGAFDRLTSTAGGAADGIKRVADAQQGVKDSTPAAEIQDIARSLADYRGMADRANAAAEQSKQAFWDGKISMAALAEAADAAQRANADLADATERQTAAEKQASPPRQKSALEFKAIAGAAEAVADSYKKTADAQGGYTAGLRAVADAQLSGLRAEIDLANAKGDTETAQRKIIELNRVEAQWAQTLASAKQAEIVAEIAATQKKLDAKQAIQAKTQADELEMAALRLKLSALDGEAKAQRATTAAKLATGPATQAAVAAIKTHNQVLLSNIDYQTRINAIRNKGLSDTQRDATLARDAEILLAKATLARFDISSKASAEEIKANQQLRQGLLQRADAMASQVQDGKKSVELLEKLQTESAQLLKDTAAQADIEAKISADDAPARKTLSGLIEWGNAQSITVPVRFSGSGGGSQGAGLIEELNRRGSAQ